MFSRSKEYSINNSKGVLIQAGVDINTKDDTVYSFEIKKMFMTSKVKYKKNFISPAVQSKLKIDPIIVSVGVGYKF